MAGEEGEKRKAPCLRQKGGGKAGPILLLLREWKKRKKKEGERGKAGSWRSASPAPVERGARKKGKKGKPGDLLGKLVEKKRKRGERKQKVTPRSSFSSSCAG